MASATTEVVLVRYIAASPEAVFSAFTTRERLVRWLSPSPDVKLSVLEFEFREGGRYRFAYHLADDEIVIVGGVYRVIDDPLRLAFSWVWEAPDEHAGIESEVIVTVTPEGSGSKLEILHIRLGRADAVTRHAEGWRGALARLANLVEDSNGD